MAKVTKSVRLEQSIESLVEDYCRFMAETMGVELTFSKIVPMALAFYIADHLDNIKSAMRHAGIVYTTGTGKIVPYEFTEEQIMYADQLWGEAMSEWMSFENN